MSDAAPSQRRIDLVTLAALAPAGLTLNRIQHDLLEVLTKGMPKAEAFKRIAKDFGIIERHLVVVDLG